MNSLYCHSRMVETATAKTTKKRSVMFQIMKSKPELFGTLKPGELVEAEYLGQTRAGAFFNLQPLTTGVVYGRELMNAREIIKSLKIHDKVVAKVIEADNGSGYAELSLAEADKQKVWQELKDMKEKGEILAVTVESANSGGLVATVKEVKAFLPVSQLSNQHYPRVADSEKERILEELKKFEGQEMQVRIITVNQKAAKLIISERNITDENVMELLKKYAVGQVVEGIISGVADFGAFVRFTDDPEVEGLIHISELDHRLVDDPREIVSVNEKVKAAVMEIKDGRVSLSLKALKPDPWKTLGDIFKEGQTVTGKPFKYNPFGAFITVEGADVQGLIHVSEFGSVEAMKEKLELEKEYQFVIETLRPEDKRLILKLKK